MRFLSLPLFVLIFTVHALNNSTQILSPAVDSFIDQILAEWNSPGGMAVAVVRADGQDSWSIETKGYGVATANGSKVTPDTIFAIGSNSKLFTVLGTGLLISNSSVTPPLSWKSKLASIIPGWKLMDPVASSESTIIDLMSHRTGLPSHDYAFFVPNDTIPALLARLPHLKPSAPFRSTFQYTNMMYAILSSLPSFVLPSRPSFGSFIKENIFEPLGLNDTTYSLERVSRTGRLADGFARDLDGVNASVDPLSAGTPRVFPPSAFFGDVGEDGNTFSGAGGIFSTANDIARWLQMLLSNGQHPITNETIVPAEVIQMAATGFSIASPNSPAPEKSAAVYGGGQIQWTYQGHVVIEHNGGLPGYNSWITRFPNDGVGIAVLSNDDLGLSIADIIKYRLADEIFGLPAVDWDSRLKEAVEEGALEMAALTSTPAPANVTALPLPLSALTGRYTNPGYGPDITLCAPAFVSDHNIHGCTSAIARLKASFPAQLSSVDLFWEWDRILATYVTLKHFDGLLFNVSGWVQLPTGNVSQPFWAYPTSLDANIAEFDIQPHGGVKGFGVRGGMWFFDDEVVDVEEPEGSTVKERSEVWWGKSGV